MPPIIHLRPVTYDDLELLLAWRSIPRIIQYFTNQNEPPTWQEHTEWWTTRPPDREDYIIQHHGRDVGTINIDPNNDIGILIGELTGWGNGLANAAINKLLEETNHDRYTAEIHTDNERSQRLFENNGFEIYDQDDDQLLYEYTPTHNHPQTHR